MIDHRSARSCTWFTTCSTSPGSPGGRSSAGGGGRRRHRRRRRGGDRRPRWTSKRHRIRSRLPSQPIMGDADPIMAQVVFNLLNNAAKYTTAGGLSRLSVGRGADTSSSGSATTASASPPRCCRASSTCSPRSTARWTDRKGGLGLGLTLVAAWSRCTEERVEAASSGWTREASSRSDCRSGNQATVELRRKTRPSLGPDRRATAPSGLPPAPVGCSWSTTM